MIFDFEDGTDQGWGTAFGDGPDGNNDTEASFPIVNIGGSNRMQLPVGAFQAASIRSNGNPYLAAMNAAFANPAVSTISYDWYVDTAGFTGATFLELGTYINSGQAPFRTARILTTPRIEPWSAGLTSRAARCSLARIRIRSPRDTGRFPRIS